MIILTIVATCVPVLIYLLIGFSPSSRARSVKDYFIYNQTVSTADYANTSVGYALQMAAIFLFVYWGALYGLGFLWTPLFWFFGFLLLIWLLPRFREYHKIGSTMHAYLADTFGGSKTVQRLAAAATILGLLGTMMAEVDYTIEIYTPFIKTEFRQMLLGAGFLIFGLAYIIRNGYKAEVNTERTQIPIAYSALTAVIVCVLPTVWTYSGRLPFYVIFSLLIFTFVLLTIGKLRLGLRVAIRDIQFYISPVGIIAALGVLWYVRTLNPGSATSVLSKPLSYQFQAQGIVGLVSLLIANAFWMPVDLSTWQRVASVDGKDDALLRSLRQGTYRVLFESPATWMLGGILGLCISAGGFLANGGDASTALAQFSSAISSPNTLAASYLFRWIAYPLFLLASVTIMLSTVHCMISAVSFTAYMDLRVSTKNETSLWKARLWTIAIMIVGMFSYPYLRFHFSASLPTLLYGAYSAQLSLFVVAILALLKKRLNKRAAIASIVGGFLGTGMSVLFAIRVASPDSEVLPPLFAVLCAIVGYIAFYKADFTSNQVEPVR